MNKAEDTDSQTLFIFLFYVNNPAGEGETSYIPTPHTRSKSDAICLYQNFQELEVRAPSWKFWCKQIALLFR